MTKNKILFIIIFLIILLISLSFIINTEINVDKIKLILSSFGLFAPVIFIGIFAIAPVFFLPITPLMLAGGFLFGPLWGTIYSLIGANIAASLSFFTSRYIAKDFITKLTNKKITTLQKNIERNGWLYVGISRILPFFPFNLQNYLFGLTSLKFKSFLLPSLIFLIPALYVYVYIGYCGQKILNGTITTSSITLILGLLSLFFILLPFIIKRHLKGLLN